jgi:hypothetical protein
MMQVFSPENVATIFFMAGEFGVARGGMKGAGTLGKKITGLFGKEVADASATLFKSFTKSNFRHNLGQLTGNIPANSQAHHVFPQAFQGRFAAKGINIHDPKFGVWWETSSHLKNAKSYNAAWESFFRTNPSPSQILDKGRQLMQQYGIQVGF